MVEEARGFTVSQEQATMVYRQLRTGSGDVAKFRGRANRERLQAQLGIDKATTSSPETAVLGQLLIAYITVSTRLIGIFEKNDVMATEDRINGQLTVFEGETSQQTLERLLEIAMSNSQLINLTRHL